MTHSKYVNITSEMESFKVSFAFFKDMDDPERSNRMYIGNITHYTCMDGEFEEGCYCPEGCDTTILNDFNDWEIQGHYEAPGEIEDPYSPGAPIIIDNLFEIVEEGEGVPYAGITLASPHLEPGVWSGINLHMITPDVDGSVSI